MLVHLGTLLFQKKNKTVNSVRQNSVRHDKRMNQSNRPALLVKQAAGANTPRGAGRVVISHTGHSVCVLQEGVKSDQVGVSLVNR